MVNTQGSNVNNLLNAVKKALESSTANNVISAKAARDFAALVNILRVTPKNDVLSVYGSVKAGAGFKEHKNAAKKIFFEALYRAGTGDAIEVAVELLLNKEIQGDQQRMLYLSLAMVKHATSNSLSTATKILDQKDLPREAYLGVGTLAGRYCRDHKCDNNDNLEKLTKKFVQKLNNCKAGNRQEENNVIALLKGLGNFKHISDAVVDTLIACANGKHVHPRVRVAALETFLAEPSKTKLKKAAMNILKNRDEDSEIRIKAYLVIATSPCGEMANQLKDLLATEPVNQVGSFIVSHLRNIRASSNPNKDLAKQHLSLIRSPKRFPFDIRRFSFNSELSYAIETFGIASSLESNVIYSQDSFLPRSANLNFTSEMFGHNLNVLEVGIRQENLDRLIEHYLGPRGVLETSKPSDIVESSKHEIEQIVNKIKQRLEKTKRGRREAVSEAALASFAKQIKLATTQVGTALDLDLSVKLFGSEVIFATINEGLETLTPDAIVDKIFDQLDAGLEKAKSFEHTFGGHIQFLDIETAYPTSLGFPLKLSLIGSAVAQVAASSNVDVRRVLQDPTNAKVAVKLVPSANVELIGSFVIDAHSVETGLQLVSNLHTATGSELLVEILNGGKGVDVKVGLPIQNQDIITVGHDIVFATRELGHQTVEVPLKFTGQRKEYRGCFDQLQQFIGLTFCGDIGVPVNSLPGVPIGGVSQGASPFPLSGPSKLSVQVQRDDSKEYHFRANYINNEAKKRKVELSFDTTGSKVNRRINLVVEGGTEPDKYIVATLDSPIKKAVLEGRIINNGKELSVNAKIAYDNQEFSGKLGILGQGNEASFKYTPLIQFKTPKRGSSDINGYKVEGAIIVEKSGNKKTYKFDNVRLVSPNGPPININGHIGKDGPTYETDLQVSQDKHKGSLKSSLTFVSTENLKLNVEVQNSLNPNLNVHIAGEHKRSIQAKEGKGEFDNKLEIIHGQDLKSSKNKLYLANSGKYSIESYKKFDMEANNKLEYSLVNLIGIANVHLTCHSLDWDLQGTYDKFKASSKLASVINKKSTGDYSVDLQVEALNNKLNLLSSRDVVGPNKSKLKNSLQVQDRKYEIDADVVHQFKSNDVNAQVNAVVKLAGKPEAIKVNEALIFNAHAVEIRSEIKDGETKLVDILFKSNRAGSANGNLKINVPSIVQADGSLVVKDGKGTGNIVIDLKKLQRKVKGDASFTAVKPTYNAKLVLELNADKEPNQKIMIQTENQISEKSIKSNNKLNILGSSIEANVNGNLQGEFANGVVSGDADLLLPTGHYIAGKINRDVKSNQGIVNANVNGEIEVKKNKAGKGYKVSASVVAKDTDMKRHVFDISGKLAALKEDGKNVELTGAIKHGHIGDKRTSSASFKAGGSALPNTLEGALDAEYGKKYIKSKSSLKSSCGASAGLTAALDIGNEAENKYSYDVAGEVITGQEKYAKMSVKSHLAVTRPLSGAELLEVSTSNAFGVNDKIVKVDGSVRGNKETGSGKLSVSLSDGTPITASAHYKRQGTESIQVGADLEQVGKDGKNVKLGVSLNKPNNNEINVRVNAVTSIESAKTVDLSVTLKVRIIKS